MSLHESGMKYPRNAGGLMRRSVVLLAALLLACTLMAGAVSADGITDLSGLKTALESAEDGSTVILTQSISGDFAGAGSYDGYINITGKAVTLDLAGKTITANFVDSNNKGTNKFIAVGNSTAGFGSLTVTGNGKITITNATTGNKGAISMFLVVRDSSLIIQNGEFTAPHRVIGGMAGNNGKYEKSNITINGGKLITQESEAVIYLNSNKSKLYINGGEIIGSTGIDARTGTIVMTGGTIKATGMPNTEEKKNGYSANTGSAISLTGMTQGYEYALDIKLEGGTITSEHGFGILNYADGRSGQTGERKVSLSGATVTGTLGAYCVNKTYDPTVIVSGTWTATTFDSLKALLEAGANVKLGADITNHDFGTSGDEQRIVISSGSPMLDLNGHTLSATTAGNHRSFIKISNDSDEAKLTVQGSGTISVTGSSSANPYLFFVGKNGDLQIDSGTYTSSAFLISGNGNKDPSWESPNITINGGTFTSSQTAIYMPADAGELTINDGTITSQASGIDIRAGTVTINGGTITANGAVQDIDWTTTAQPLSDGSAIILASVDNDYSAQITVNIAGTANIISTNAAAITNYVRTGDGKTASPSVSVTIKGDAKLSGKTAVLQNIKRTDIKAVIGTFTLNGGYYKFTDTTNGKLLKDVTPQYQPGYAMSDTPVEGGYYAPVAVQTPEKPAETTADGKEVTGVSGSIAAASGDVATITQNAGVASGIKVNLTLTYPSGTNLQADPATRKITASAAPTTVIAEYSPVNLDNTIGGFFNLIVEFSNVTNITRLPNISTTINPEAQAKLEDQGLSLMSMVVVDITQMKAAGETPKLTLTFTVPISKFTGKDLGSLRAYHYDGKDLKEWSAVPTRTTQGTNYVFTVSDITEASPWMLGARTSTPTPPTPQPVYSSGDGNMENAFRVLFDTQGGSYVSPATGLSAGDKITLPAAPTKDGSSFVGWYKDAACTQAWSFSETIDGDMTLYAKWSGGSSGSAASATTVATAKQTTKATTAPAATTSQRQAAATTAAPAATTAAGVSPTLTQAPAPVFGALLGLLAAGVLLRRRD